MIGKFLALLLLLVQESYGQTRLNFFDERSTGWYNFEEFATSHKKNLGNQAANRNKTPSEQLKTLTHQAEEILAQAVMSPTEENVLNYISMQDKIMKISGNFQNTWNQTILKHPEYDYTKQFPIDHFAMPTFYVQEDDKMSQVIANLKNDYGLFYFYSSKCPYCQAFSSVVKNFADNYGWIVRAISIDGGPAKEFPDAIIDKGQYQQLIGSANKQVPILLAFDSKNKKIIEIARGAISEKEIVRNIYILTGKRSGGDYSE